jgi:uncharacterized OB-fold protein
MNIKGKVVAITEAKEATAKLTTQTFVVEYDKKMTQDKTRKVLLAFEQRRTDNYDSIKKWDGVQVGDVVEVQFNEPESREYNGRYFTGVEAWSVKAEGAHKPSGGTAANVNSDNSDLPF